MPLPPHLNLFQRGLRFFQKELVPEKSSVVDRLIFLFFVVLNWLGKTLSPRLLKKWIYQRLLHYLLSPLPSYDGSQTVLGTQEERNVFLEYKKARFLEAAHPGDIILIQGKQRISRIIQTLTHSPYSHAAYYRANGELIEVEPEGVIVSSIDKYIDLDIRICRPAMLSSAGRKKVEDHLEQMLKKQPKYDIVNIEKLLFKYWYSKFRPDLKMYIGGSTKFETYYLCSGMIAHAFQKAEYPIAPSITIRHKKNKPMPHLTNVNEYFKWIRHSPKNYSQIVPADFDNSSFFASIKFLFLHNEQRGPKPYIQWSHHKDDTFSGK